MAATDNANQNLVVTALWEVHPGEEGAIASLLKDFLPHARQEPGVREFQIHQNMAEPRKFFFYEVFADSSDSVGRPGCAELGGHVGLATQYPSLSPPCLYGRIADEQYRPQ